MVEFDSKKIPSSQQILRYTYIVTALLVIISLIPTNQKFKYDFELGKPWQYEDLLAPFKYPILKSDAQLDEEKAEIKNNFEPFYEKDESIRSKALSSFNQALKENIGQFGSEIEKEKEYIKAGEAIINTIYAKGLIELEAKHKSNDKTQRIHLITNKIATRKKTSDFYTIFELKDVIQNKVDRYSKLNPKLLRNSILYGLQPDITFDAEISENKLLSELNSITPNRGLVEAGELIISKGLTVTEDEFIKLESLRKQYQELVKNDGQTIHLLGYIILVVLIFIIYIGYIQLFQIELIRKNRRLLLLLLNIILFVFLARYVTLTATLNIYIIPFCVMPIIVLAFFDYRLALISHIVLVLIVGSFVSNNAAEFILIQLIAGFVSIISMIRVQYLSQFFISTLYVLGSYVISYTAFRLIEITNFSELNGIDYLWLLGNFMLTLLAYPLIYAYEKLFGFVSDITLVELCDVNKKILRQLSIKAPGTFQHSLQVANLSESVINHIGGRVLLTRVGALYHDIGKMERPEYFIENQKYIDNPHDVLSDEESAHVIIDHVNAGIKMAKQENLPSVIIEFIKTHHGTSRVEYFYRNYLKKVPADEVDESKFRYPGPRPATREMAVVMICDSIEAATRSIKDKNPNTIERMIDGIIDGKLNDKQLQNAPITLQEIEKIRILLKELINSMYHVRIEYPEEKLKAQKVD